MGPLVLILEHVDKCDTCPLYAPSSDDPGFGRCLKTGKDTCPAEHTELSLGGPRPEWCPLVPLPRPWDYKAAGSDEALNWMEGYNVCLNEVTDYQALDDWKPRSEP